MVRDTDHFFCPTGEFPQFIVWSAAVRIQKYSTAGRCRSPIAAQCYCCAMMVGVVPPPLPEMLLLPYDEVAPEIDDVLKVISELRIVTVPLA
jgi:hypothetical protein